MDAEIEQDDDPHLITRVLDRVRRKEPRAANELLPLVYKELRRLAQSRIARLEAGQTLQATALVHEAWIRVVGSGDPGWECRAHFFGAAAQAMRNIMVEQSRKKSSLKHGGNHIHIDQDDAEEISVEAPVDNVLLLDDALRKLEKRDPVKARLVELRFFTGLTMPEVAEVLGLPLTRVERDWRFTRAWLQREIEGLQID
ncbi:MAG: RNA polymerase sigma factor (TIGR02999 family) [Planctomycetota bacterium]|jgi:RNA polymerase sigma factor (TIGR02999 family)